MAPHRGRNASGNNQSGRSHPITPPITPPKTSVQTNGSFEAAKLPWELNIGYRKPDPKDGRSGLAFKWDHDWKTYNGKDPIQEWTKEVAAYIFLTLPIPAPDMSKKRLASIEATYHHIGKSEVFNIRKRNMNAGVRFDSTLIFTSHLPSLSNTITWSRSNQAMEPVDTPLHRALTNNRNPGLLQFVASPGKSEYCANPNIFNILAMPELGEKIINYLKPSLRDLSAFAMACKMTSNMVRQYLEVWDFKSLSFPVDRFETKTEVQEVYGEQREVVIQGGGVRSNTLLITGAGNDIRKTEQPYSESFDAMIDLLAAVRKAPTSFRDVILHRLPFLDTRMLRIMINSMPNLETISISSCLLLDASKLPMIIKIIRESSRKHIDKEGKEVQSFIKVDFSPYRFFGPESEKRLGSYIITHHKPTFDIPKAATALLLKCLDEADDIGMDLIGDSSSFWHFFRQLPGPCPLWAVKVRETIKRMRINQGKEEGKTAAKYDPDLLLDNLCAAVSGDFRASCKLPGKRAEEWKRAGEGEGSGLPKFYWRKYWTCTSCKKSNPASLFVQCMPRGENGDGIICWACSYQEFAQEIEHSHFRYRKRIIISHLLDGFSSVTATVNDILMKDNLLQAVRKKRTMTKDNGDGEDVKDEEESEPKANEPLAVEDLEPSSPKDETIVTVVSAQVSGSPVEAPRPSSPNNETPGTGVSTEVKDPESTDKEGKDKKQPTRELTPEQQQAAKDTAKEKKQKRLTERVARVYQNPRLNYNQAYLLTKKTDEAWKYYKSLKPLVVEAGGWGAESDKYVHYPELDGGEHDTHAGAMYRFLRLFNRLEGPSDHRLGGPQYRHSCSEPFPTGKAQVHQYKLSEEDFEKGWKPRMQHYRDLKDRHAREVRQEVTKVTYFRTWLKSKDEQHLKVDHVNEVMACHANEIKQQKTTKTDLCEWLKSKDEQRLTLKRIDELMERHAGEINRQATKVTSFRTWLKSRDEKPLIKHFNELKKCHTNEINEQKTKVKNFRKWLKQQPTVEPDFRKWLSKNRIKNTFDMEKLRKEWRTEDQRLQNKHDWFCHYINCGRVEDATWSLSTSGFAIYNLDESVLDLDKINGMWNTGSFGKQ